MKVPRMQYLHHFHKGGTTVNADFTGVGNYVANHEIPMPSIYVLNRQISNITKRISNCINYCK